MVLLSVELLLSIPISNAKVERMFSLMNRVKTDSQAALSEHTLNNLVRIRMEGPPLEEFDPTPAIQLWASSANRHPNQRARKQYNSRDSAKRPKVLIEHDDSSPEESYDTDDNEENKLARRFRKRNWVALMINIFGELDNLHKEVYSQFISTVHDILQVS